MAAIVQKGTSILIGYGGVSYSGYVLQSGSVEATGTQKEILNTDNATMTVLVENLGVQYTIEALILTATTGFTAPPAQGDSVTITQFNPQDGTPDNLICRCVNSSVALSPEEMRLSLTLIKEVSMTYS